MATEKVKFDTVDQYIGSFGKEDRQVLENIRQTIKKALPAAEEVISYQIPAYKQNGFVIYFSCYTAHYSLSIPPSTVFEKFKKELSGYNVSKSTVQLPKGQPIPYGLITDMAKYKAKENEANAAAKKK
ncbi:DUF1801 domain-containing protein [Chitinophaga sp. YIM B06452]|uniref:iron chaperone n=1 Tax=Chitinophaga sp. YIM B06452 TaxID=3082158 RepID=UPI0031FEBE78